MLCEAASAFADHSLKRMKKIKTLPPFEKGAIPPKLSRLPRVPKKMVRGKPPLPFPFVNASLANFSRVNSLNSHRKKRQQKNATSFFYCDLPLTLIQIPFIFYKQILMSVLYNIYTKLQTSLVLPHLHKQ